MCIGYRPKITYVYMYVSYVYEFMYTACMQVFQNSLLQ